MMERTRRSTSRTSDPEVKANTEVTKTDDFKASKAESKAESKDESGPVALTGPTGTKVTVDADVAEYLRKTGWK